MTQNNQTLTTGDIATVTPNGQGNLVGTRKPSFADHIRKEKQEQYEKDRAENGPATKPSTANQGELRVMLGDVIHVKPGTGDKSDYIFISAFAEDGKKLAKQTMVQIHVGQGLIEAHDIAYGAKITIAGKKLEMTELTYPRKDRNGKHVEDLPIYVLRGIEDASLMVVEHRKENVQLEKTDELREGGIFAKATAAVKSVFWKGDK